MSTKAGRDWWSEHGVPTFVVFDLKSGSRSLTDWFHYLAEKAAEKSR